MKNSIKYLAFISLLFLSTIAHGNIASVEIQVGDNNTANLSEYSDMTIRALDQNGNVYTSYDGEILIFSESDSRAEFPGINENVYEFKPSDQGVVTFQNAVKFSSVGVHNVVVYDYNDMLGEVEVEVISSSTQTSREEEISITSPQNGTTIPNNDIKISGFTQPNHQVKIVINSDNEETTISSPEGMYEIEISDLENGENFIEAYLLDADGNTIGSSDRVLITVDSSNPRFLGITKTPDGVVEGEKEIQIKVNATAGLREVNLIVNDFLYTLMETNPGEYEGNITSPSNDGEYSIDVILKGELGAETREPSAGSIVVENIELKAAEPEEEIIEEIIEEIDCDELKDGLNIENIKVTKMRSKSVLSWDHIEDATYNVYKKDSETQEMTFIKNVSQAQVEIDMVGEEIIHEDFAIKALLKTESCEVESPEFSEMTQVQTGTKEILLVLLAMMIGLGIAMFRRYESR